VLFWRALARIADLLRLDPAYHVMGIRLTYRDEELSFQLKRPSVIVEGQGL